MKGEAAHQRLGALLAVRLRACWLARCRAAGSDADPGCGASCPTDPVSRCPRQVAFGVKELSKPLLLALLPALFSLAPARLRAAWQPHAVHPAGLWRPDSPAVVAIIAEAVSAPEAHKEGQQQGSSGVSTSLRSGERRPARARGRDGGVLLKSAKLAYDVDFARKFVNYGLTVWAVGEFGRLSAALLGKG
jgi:hypothetical protein